MILIYGAMEAARSDKPAVQVIMNVKMHKWDS